MASLNKRSLDNLAQCHADLRKVAHECIKTFNFTVIAGHRGKAAQDEAVRTGKSRARWPTSKHNSKPSRAFDAIPIPLDWNDIASFRRMGAAMKAAATRVRVRIRWGGDFKGWFDGPHFELS